MPSSRKFQWTQLSVLMMMHSAVDMFAGFMPAILPVMLVHFDLKMAEGIALLSVLNITTNVMQIVTGHLRAGKRGPLFLWIAFLLAGTMCLIGLVPAGPYSLVWLIFLMIIGGTGVAVFHPESMRTVHGLVHISSEVKTPFVMMGGYLGYCGGAWLGAVLVQRWQLPGLLLLLPLAGIGAGMVFAMKFRLAVEEPVRKGDPVKATYSFWPLFAMAIPVTIGTTFLVSLLPTQLNLLGFSLSFGGLASFIFGAGVGLGGVFWGMYARRKGELLCSAVSLFLAAPFILLYVRVMAFKASMGLLLVCGFCAGAGYPMLVSLARHARGMNLGGRMALIIGGVWGIASVTLLAMGPVAGYLKSYVGLLDPLLHAAWILFLLSGIYGLFLLSRRFGKGVSEEAEQS